MRGDYTTHFDILFGVLRIESNLRGFSGRQGGIPTYSWKKAELGLTELEEDDKEIG